MPDFQVKCVSLFTDFRLKRAGQLSCCVPLVNLDWHHFISFYFKNEIPQKHPE